MKIYDYINLKENNQLAILYRMEQMNNIVDYFIVVDTYNEELNNSLFINYINKIRYLKSQDIQERNSLCFYDTDIYDIVIVGDINNIVDKIHLSKIEPKHGIKQITSNNFASKIVPYFIFKSYQSSFFENQVYPKIDISNVKYSIVIPTYNHCDDLLKPCLESIKQTTDLSNVEVIVVANGCVDNTKEYVESLGEPFKLIWFDDGLGYAKATNEGIKNSKGEYIILLNNDTVLLPQQKNYWIELLENPFIHNKKIGITGPQKVIATKEKEHDFMIFFCVMIPKFLFDEIGLLDEDFEIGYFEDVDYCVRIENNDYKQVCISDYQFVDKNNNIVEIESDGTSLSCIAAGTFPIIHKGSHTMNDELLVPNRDKMYDYNKELLLKKHNNFIKQKNKIYDCFPFFNELELLEIRLEELYDTVDKFVLTESRLTHSGLNKPLYYLQNIERFAKYKDKIIHKIVDLDPNTQDPWNRERSQRDMALNAIKDIASDNDYIIVSDVDEIPSVSSIKQFISDNTHDVGILKQERCMFYFNYRNIETNEPQSNSRISTYKTAKRIGLTGIRYCDKENIASHYIIPNGGWHFTFMGGKDAVIKKIQSFAHQEYNTPDKLNNIENLINEGKDIYTSKTSWEFININKSFPKAIVRNQKHYESIGFIKPLQTTEIFMNNSFDMIEDNNKKTIEDNEQNYTVTCSISTRNRYFTSLPHCLFGIINQTRVPDELIIWDDGDHLDLREQPIYQNIFRLLDFKKIKWYVNFGSGEGQIKNHQLTLDTSTCDLIWRLDDDNIPEANVLETLLKHFKQDTGAIAGLVIDPKNNYNPNPNASNKIDDIYRGLNEQWFLPLNTYTIKEVDHLYSSFLFRKSAASHGYELSLSRVGHREETIFTYEMKRAGWKNLITPECITWHLHEDKGGIRDNTKEEMWKHDEEIFATKLNIWHENIKEDKLIVLDSGIGDHFAFKIAFRTIQELYPNEHFIISCCFPDVFYDVNNISLISIADIPAHRKGEREKQHIYRWMILNNWKTDLVSAYIEMYKTVFPIMKT